MQSTLLCRARFFAEHSPLQSTLLCRARSFAEHAPQSTLLCRALSSAERSPLQSTLLCAARFFAEYAPLQSRLLCRARFFAEHSPLQSTLLCRARFFAERAPLQSALLCRAGQALSLEGVFQMDSILPERLLALVRPGNDLVLRRIRNLKRCVEACGCKIMTPRYAQQFGSTSDVKLCQKKPLFPFFRLAFWLGASGWFGLASGWLGPFFFSSPCRNAATRQGFESFAGRGRFLDGRVPGASQVE